MSKIANGFVLFSLLLALSLGVAFAEGPAATETAPANDTNVSENVTPNATINATPNATELMPATEPVATEK